ncbi:MAG: ABC transporter ATP-binding protein [Candidatus Bathyarchaeia archaeon]|jgi:iron complex transport system ATP-binding protein
MPGTRITDYVNVVELHDVSVTFDETRVIRHVDWIIRKGQHWALIGPNGSGKTTLLRVINGYLWPTTGSAAVLGKKFGACDLRELRKSIGFASSFMSDKTPPELPVLQVVLSGRFASIGLYDRPSTKEVKRARSLLGKVGCLQLAAKRYHTLSQGEKQRIVIARALMSSPKILILDESCAGLDLDAREDLLRLVDSLGRSATSPTMIFATHRVEEISPVFTHVLLIKKGRIVASGSKKAVLNTENLRKGFRRDLIVVRRKGRYNTILS